MPSNNLIRIALIVIILSMAGMACGINLPVNQPAVPTTESIVVPLIPTTEPPLQPTLEPTIQAPVYARAQIGSYLSLWLTYDPAVWSAAKWVDGANQSGEEIDIIGHKTLAGCSLHDNLGHGVPTNWSFARFTREIGGVVFQIDQFTDMNTNNPVLVIYQYPAGENLDSAKRIELEPGNSPYDCITAADAVIALSIADITH